MENLNRWLEHYEPLWLFIVLVFGLGCEAMTWKYARLSHFFEKQKLARYKGWNLKRKETQEHKDISICIEEHK